MSFRKALVTGGAGFIGSHLSAALLERGLEVTVLDDLSVGTRERVPTEATLVVGSILDPAKVAEALEDVEIVFHEAAKVSIRLSIEEFAEDAQVNLMGTVNVLSACAGAGVKKLVYASSMAVYADSPSAKPISESYTTEPISPYGVSKLASEKYCTIMGKALGVETVALRYFNTFGPWQTFTPYVGVITIFCHKLLAGQAPVVFGTGEQRRDFVHVDDVVQANLLAMDKQCPGEVFNVGTGTARSVKEIAALLRDRIQPDMQPLHGPVQTGELTNSVADISKAASMLGYRPQHTFEGRINEVIAWNRKLVNQR